MVKVLCSGKVTIHKHKTWYVPTPRSGPTHRLADLEIMYAAVSYFEVGADTLFTATSNKVKHRGLILATLCAKNKKLLKTVGS